MNFDYSWTKVFKILFYISYFLFVAPELPNNVQARARSTSEIFIKWSPPIAVHGELEHYIVTVKKVSDRVPTNQNFCYERKTFFTNSILFLVHGPLPIDKGDLGYPSS